MVSAVNRRKALALLLLLNRINRRKKRVWVHELNQRRRQRGAFYQLVAELQFDSELHRKYFRMTPLQMDYILSMIGSELQKQDTNYRKSIEPKQRLAVTLRFLATGESFRSLAFAYRLGRKTVADSVYMTCRAIVQKLLNTYMPKPTEEAWREIAAGFWEKWQFPNCIGAIDGKHITIQAPANSGSQFFNYKNTFSIVLLALVDADSRFRLIQVGDFGRSSDGGVYANSDLGVGMDDRTLNVPKDCPLPGTNQYGDVPFMMVGDAAFPLKRYLMRPYPGHSLSRPKQKFNYRLSRARMTVECAFGILAARWRVFYTRICALPCHVDILVMAACVLHNYLLNPTDSQWFQKGRQQERPGNRDTLVSVRNMGGNRGSREAFHVRELLCEFFNEM
ncbi:radial spoke head protein 3 homolog isoform X1 [Sardina pilchardus]|uniref:radial spoke head protein 3 homolog isoform X1 n=1 Tax=Sardina pilchardus TaxID=27697 RepID=UPI002E10931D